MSPDPEFDINPLDELKIILEDYRKYFEIINKDLAIIKQRLPDFSPTQKTLVPLPLGSLRGRDYLNSRSWKPTPKSRHSDMYCKIKDTQGDPLLNHLYQRLVNTPLDERERKQFIEDNIRFYLYGESVFYQALYRGEEDPK